jgi:hypothetical protein
VRNPYEVLGCKVTSKPSEIKKAYKHLSKEYHPDLHPDDPKAEERFLELHRAYEVLIDPDIRRVFDETGYVPEEHAVSIEEEALSLISDLLGSLVAKYKTWIIYIDILGEMIEALHGMQEKCTGDKTEQSEQHKMLVEISTKVLTQAEVEENLIKELLERLAEKPEKVVHDADRFILVSNKALDTLSKYSYIPKKMTGKQEEELDAFLHPKSPFADFFGDGGME